MKTPGKKILDAINPGNWAKAGVKEAGEQVRKGIDENTYSQEESAENTNKRHAADMASDSQASKSVRPFAFYAFFVLFLLIVFTKIEVEPWAQDMIKTSFYMILGWYFGERGLIKVIREVKKRAH